MKRKINAFLKRFGFELHGSAYIYKLKANAVSDAEWDFQKKYLLNKRSPVIFDVGANICHTIDKYLVINNKVIIHGFEPTPKLFTALKEKYKSYSSIRLSSFAVSNKAGVEMLNLNKSLDTNSLMNSVKLGVSSDSLCETLNTVEVKLNTIDNYCLVNNIPNIDLIKIDVQGYELRVLKGASKMLSNSAIGCVFIELYFKEQYEDQPLFAEIYSFLVSHGFLLRDIYNRFYSDKGDILWCDAIFLNNNSK